MDKFGELIERMDACMPKIMEALRNARARNPWSKKLNINQGNILAMLCKETTQTMTRLTVTTGLAKSALTGLTDQMVEKGYLFKERSEVDKRQFVVHLSPEGLKLAKEIRLARTMNIGMILSQLPEEEQESAVIGYERLVQAFWEINND